jgi:hypothetical protein
MEDRDLTVMPWRRSAARCWNKQNQPRVMTYLSQITSFPTKRSKGNLNLFPADREQHEETDRRVLEALAVVRQQP